MRTFIGLEPDGKTKLAIANWRENSLPHHSRAIAPENFHVTLAFLGEISPDSLESISQLPGLTKPLSVKANFVGHFSKPGIGFLGITSNETLSNLKTCILQKLPDAIRPAQEKQFIPHITLFRGLEQPLPTPLMEPDFTLEFSQVHLFESTRLNRQVKYKKVLSW